MSLNFSGKVTSVQMLVVICVVLLVLIVNIVVGTVLTYTPAQGWIWAGVVVSLSGTGGLLIIACVLIHMMGKIRMNE